MGRLRLLVLVKYKLLSNVSDTLSQIAQVATELSQVRHKISTQSKELEIVAQLKMSTNRLVPNMVFYEASKEYLNSVFTSAMKRRTWLGQLLEYVRVEVVYLPEMLSAVVTVI